MSWTLVQLRHRIPEAPWRHQPGHKLTLGLSVAVKTLPPWSWVALLDGRCTLRCAAYLTASSSSDQGKGQAEHHQHQHQHQHQRGKTRQGKDRSNSRKVCICLPSQTPLNPLGSANSISTCSASQRCAQAKVEDILPNQRRRDQDKPQLRAVPSSVSGQASESSLSNFGRPIPPTSWVPPSVFQSPTLQTSLSFSPARCSTMRAVILSRLTSTSACRSRGPNQPWGQHYEANRSLRSVIRSDLRGLPYQRFSPPAVCLPK
ncbi:hypothetical protein CORC01_04387 [Colletotrichum orchidophilum]|uniref:Uncharacterized protein n=1 Tax=Colletotrichum orchidophilum TaxID=1209926 RepID=A0A1G4BGC5_9PEZI|nr:uncharacterized protein CORC01_04387 [Colletotrichum orchidophilum]OHF00406.1 hypothetical protein CORC01_04387 [Colletotrichum orchidophilum]